MRRARAAYRFGTEIHSTLLQAVRLLFSLGSERSTLESFRYPILARHECADVALGPTSALALLMRHLIGRRVGGRCHRLGGFPKFARTGTSAPSCTSGCGFPLRRGPQAQRKDGATGPRAGDSESASLAVTVAPCIEDTGARRARAEPGPVRQSERHGLSESVHVPPFKKRAARP
jgi:hypothetical protein